MRKVIDTLSLIPVTILAIVLAYNANIFSYFSFISDDIVTETAITAYITIFDIIKEVILDKVEKYIKEQQVCVDCVFFKSNDNADISHNPSINIRSGNVVSEVEILIRIKGNKEKVKNSEIRISFPKWVDIQNGNKNSDSVVDGREWKIKLNNITSESLNVERKFKILIIKNQSDDGLMDEVEFKYINDKTKLNRSVNYNSNKLILYNIQ